LRILTAPKAEQGKKSKVHSEDKIWLGNALQDLESLDRAICQFFAEKTGALFSVFFASNDEQTKVWMTAQHNATEYHQVMAQSHNCEFDAGEAPPGIALQKGVACKFDHLATNEAYAPWLAIALESGYNCLWSFPLKDDKGVAGVVQVFYAEENYDLTTDQLAFIQAFGKMCAPYVRLAQKAKRESTREKQLTELVVQHPEPLCWFGHDGKIKLVNIAFADLVGSDGSELNGSFINEILAESSRNGYVACVRDEHKPVELELKSESASVPLLIHPLYTDGDVLSGYLALKKPELKPEPAQVATAATDEAAPKVAVVDDSFRVITGELADQFGNLLTGVLGHASLVAAELSDENAAKEDVGAISRAARTAARIAKQMTVLCGAARHAGAHIDAARWLKSYVESEPDDLFAQGKPGLDMVDEHCMVTGDPATLEIILEGMSEHCANGISGEAPPLWKLIVAEKTVFITLSYTGDSMIPQGWPGELVQVHSHGKHQALLLAREAARAVNGKMDIVAEGEKVGIVLTLPMIEVEQHTGG
jgi:hypothetical protein